MKFILRKMNTNVMPHMQTLAFLQLENNCSSMSFEIVVSSNQINSNTGQTGLHF